MAIRRGEIYRQATAQSLGHDDLNSKIALMKMLHTDNDLLILDELTNHLDIESMESIEESLRTYSGALLVVSHDRLFLENINLNKRYKLTNGSLSESVSG